MPLRQTGCFVRRFDRLPSPTVALLLLGDDERSGDLRRAPVSRAVRHHGPQRAGHLVGQSNRGNFARPAFQQLQKPGTCCLAPWLGLADHRHGSHDQKLSELFVTGSADASKRLAAAGGLLLRRQAEPSCEVAGGSELSRIDLHRHRQRSDRPDTGNRRQALTDRVGFMLRSQALIDLRQLRIQLRDDPAQMGRFCCKVSECLSTNMNSVFPTLRGNRTAVPDAIFLSSATGPCGSCA